MNKEKEVKEFERELKEEFEETLAERREEYERSMNEFNFKMKAYKLQKTRKVDHQQILNYDYLLN